MDLPKSIDLITVKRTVAQATYKQAWEGDRLFNAYRNGLFPSDFKDTNFKIVYDSYSDLVYAVNNNNKKVAWNKKKNIPDYYYVSPYGDFEGFWDDIYASLKSLSREEQEWFYTLPIPLNH